jgi:hypothetical protein
VGASRGRRRYDMTKGMKFAEEGGGDETKTSRGDDNGPNTRTQTGATQQSHSRLPTKYLGRPSNSLNLLSPDPDLISFFIVVVFGR